MDPVKRDTLIADLYKRGVAPRDIVMLLRQQEVKVSLSAVQRVLRARQLLK